jgi:hypothetical protein
VNFFEVFPWAKFTMAVGGMGMGAIVLVAVARLAFGQEFPAGYDGLLYALVAMAGAGGLIGIGKRATDYTLAAIKTGDAATIASVVGPPKVANAEDGPVLTKADADRVAMAMSRPGEQGA